MGTSASTQQDMSPVANSTLQGHSIGSLSPLQVAAQRGYPQAPMPLSLEALEAHNAQMLQHSPPPLLNSPSSAHSDGYKWRKYGQKSVKGSDYPRNYYKCTFPGCTVKKYVEKYEEDGKVLEKVTYKGGDHTHDPSRITRVNATDQTSFKQSVLSESLGHQELIVKTEPRAEGLEIVDPSQSGISVLPEHAGQTIFPASPRLVVETTADVDHNDDGYSWRKYGQKNVKSSSYPTPRSYYRCTQEDCPVKKQVEQRGNIIYNTYEGTHNHLAPGWEEVKKKRKLNRSSLEKTLMNRVIEENKQAELEGDLSEKTIEEGEALPKGFHHPTAEEAMTLVIAEAAQHAHDRALNIPLQDLQTESALSAPMPIPENISLQMSGGIPIDQLQQGSSQDGSQ